MAVSVQRLTVPDLVVVLDQTAQPSPVQLARTTQTQSIALSPPAAAISHSQPHQPQAASLIKHQDLTQTGSGNQAEQQLTFECLVSYDRKKDKNLIIKWHHDDRVEPIYQWIVELDKISIAPQYKPYILANTSPPPPASRSPPIQDPSWQQHQQQQRAGNSAGNSSSTNQAQLLEAGFRLIRPSKELGGKYTCSAISVQNDDSKWRKMIVFTPPRSFRFNATRTDFSLPSSSLSLSLDQQRLSPRDRGLFRQTSSQLDQQAPAPANEQSPYRSTGSSGSSNIDYVNVNPNYRQPRPTGNGAQDPTLALQQPWQQQQRRPPPPSPLLMATNGLAAAAGTRQPASGSPLTGVKLVCDIDQIFPVPEVSIYRLAGSKSTHDGGMVIGHPVVDKLTKSETRIEKNPLNGLYHIQVISVLLDDEIVAGSRNAAFSSNSQQQQQQQQPSEPVHFECLIGLTNLELSKYSDNKRTLVYRPNSALMASQVAATGQQQQQHQNDMEHDNRISGNLERSSCATCTVCISTGPAVAPTAILFWLMMNSLLLTVFQQQHHHHHEQH